MKLLENYELFVSFNTAKQQILFALIRLTTDPKPVIRARDQDQFVNARNPAWP